MISVIIPTYGRAPKLAAVNSNIHGCTVTEHEVIFVVEADDHDSQEMVRTLPDARLHVNTHKVGYPGAVNSAFEAGVGEYFFTGVDDLSFHYGWDEKVLVVMKNGTMVASTNDLVNPQVLAGVQATHIFISRQYIEERGGSWNEPPGVVFHEGYGRGPDCEVVTLAIMRDVFAPCLDSIVEHMYFDCGKRQRDATDDRCLSRGEGDQQLCYNRTLEYMPASAQASEEAYIAFCRERLQKRGVL